MKIDQARAFVRKVAGHELCAGAGADEAAQYPVSPIAKAFMEGAIGFECVSGDYMHHRAGQQIIANREMGKFFVEVGQALIDYEDDNA